MEKKHAGPANELASHKREFGQGGSGGRPSTDRTGAKERRCTGEAPSFLSAAKC
jgi:hypothetical protein